MSKMKNHILAVIILAIVSIIMTYPLNQHFNSYIPGFFSSDEPYAAIWNYWRIKHCLIQNLSLKLTDLICFPFGIDLMSSGFVSYPKLGLFSLLAFLTNPIATYNIQALLNLFLSGLFLYLILYFLTEQKMVSLFAGIIFTFSPQHLVRIWQHLEISYFQWIPLILLSAILLKKKYRRNRFFLFVGSVLLLFYFDWSIMYLGMFSLAVFLLYSVFYNWRIKYFQKHSFFKVKEDFEYLKWISAAMLLVLLILSPQSMVFFKGYLGATATEPSAFNPYHRPFEDLFAQSARPLSYFLPATFHPIFGKFTQQFIGSGLYGVSFTEHTLYLGWTPIILAFVAFKRWRKIRKLHATPHTLHADENFYIGFFVFLAITAWLFSQPPWWQLGNLKIYLPSFFMYKLMPMFRAYCRFGIVVMLAISALAGFGLKSILEKFSRHSGISQNAGKTQKSKIAITTIFCSLVLFEFWNYPPFKVIEVSKVPTVYYWLKDQPGDLVIAEYPLDSEGPNEMYKFYQITHHKKLINGTIPGTYANKVAKTIIKLSDPATAGVLKWMKVRYVLVHRERYLNSELIEEIAELNKISSNPRLKLIKNFPSQDCPQKDIMCVQKTGPIDVYEVIAKPTSPKIDR